MSYGVPLGNDVDWSDQRPISCGFVPGTQVLIPSRGTFLIASTRRSSLESVTDINVQKELCSTPDGQRIRTIAKADQRIQYPQKLVQGLLPSGQRSAAMRGWTYSLEALCIIPCLRHESLEPKELQHGRRVK